MHSSIEGMTKKQPNQSLLSFHFRIKAWRKFLLYKSLYVFRRKLNFKICLRAFDKKESKFCSICCSAWVMSIKTIIQFQSIIINYSLRVTIQRDYSDTSWVSNLSYTLKVILGYFFKHYSPVSVWQEHQFATFNPSLYQLKSGTISLFRQSPLYLKDISTK